ncbi:uncharacterized protein [Asterias amurensis]|uniref:uncharacterized protein isoform X1 n=1 Tax=Asterias amurensis TaxID=7602 RepID=UPI003AB5A2A5
MGNCLESCFGSVRKNKTSYFTGRYKEYNVGIEFESLIEDDLAQQAETNMVTDRERDHLLNKRYSDLIKDQKRRDAEIEAELKRQEDNVRLEEEAYNIAKRESARAARQTRALEQQRSKPIANGTAKSSWLGDNETEWNVAGGEDDFEMFLESVKARSQTVRANVAMLSHQQEGHTNKLSHKDSTTGLEWDYEEEAGLAAISCPTTQSSSVDDRLPLPTKKTPNSNSEGLVSVQDAPSEQVESDSDWVPDFVGASLEGVSSTPDLQTSHVTEASQALNFSQPSPLTNLTDVEAQMHYGETVTHETTETIGEIEETKSHMTQLINVQSVNEPNKLNGIVLTNNEVDKQLPSQPVNNISVTKSSELNGVASTKTQDDKQIPSHAVNNNISVAKSSENRTEESTETNKSAAAEIEDEDPFDFDKFLEDLDLE